MRQRRIGWAEGAWARFNDLRPSLQEVEAVGAILERAAKDDPNDPAVGFEIPFSGVLRERTWRVDVGRFAVHYQYKPGRLYVTEVWLS